MKLAIVIAMVHTQQKWEGKKGIGHVLPMQLRIL